MSVRKWPEGDRPREKLLVKGEHHLTTAELLAVLLRTGTQGRSSLDLARQVLAEFKTLRAMSGTHTADWRAIKGMGLAKIAQVKAALEIGRRFREEEVRQEGVPLLSSSDVAGVMMPRMRDLRKEVVKVIFLDSQNHVIYVTEAEEGTVNYSQPIIREIFEAALQAYAASLICVHNHPSGDPSPSGEDKRFTARLCEAGKILQVTVLDHIIIGNDRYYSFADTGEMEKPVKG